MAKRNRPADLPPCGGDVRQDRGGQHRARRLPLLSLLTALASPALAADLPDGFVRLADVDATILQSMNYARDANFIGRIVKGYEAPVCILTRAAAEALARVQARMARDGLSLVMFDCYRPERAVKDFMDWIGTGGPPDPKWYPRVRREDLHKQGYLARRSAHSRGSTVDLGIVRLEQAHASIDPDCGAGFGFMLEFGTGYDCLDPLSATAHAPLPADSADNRKLLVDAMAAEGFRNYSKEWWHFTLNGEPFPKEAFDFPVTAAE
ncbi:MAG: M15 family metallopeptidase [Rhizobiaceae bacterium]|nr:M15 family metallopeptidase [Rhizobiaceae bacterium]